MKHLALFVVTLCVSTSCVYSGPTNSAASTSSSSMQDSLTPAVLPFMVTTHITAVGEAFSKALNESDKTTIDNALDVLGYYAMELLLTENEHTTREENIFETTGHYLAQFGEQECHIDHLRISADLINEILQSPIRRVSNSDLTSLRKDINDLTELSQHILRSQQEPTVEQCNQLKDTMLTVIQKTIDCCKQ